MFHPQRILLAGFVIYLAIYIVAPLEPYVDISTGSFVFIGVCCLAFWLGCHIDNYIALGRRFSSAPFARVGQREMKLLRLVFALGAFGNGIRLFDKYILRGASGLIGSDAREMLIETGASSLSIVGAAFYPFGYIPLFIYLSAKAIPRQRHVMLICLVLFLIPAIDALVIFSRSFMLVTLSMLYFGTSITLYQGRALPWRLVLPALIGVVIVVGLSVLLFSLRLSQMDLNAIDSIFMSGYGYTIGPNDFAKDIFADRDAGPAAALLTMFLPITQYFTHSLFEFQLLWQEVDMQIHSYGALHFAPYLKILSIFGIQALTDASILFPRVGIFTSFFGPLWVDFGWFSPVVMMFFGIFIRHVGRMAQAGDIGAYPLYTYFCIILFFAPVVNFVISSQGMYNITAFIIFLCLSRSVATLRVTDVSK